MGHNGGSPGHGGGHSGSGGPKPGEGYRFEIGSVRRVLKPLEESVVAARKIKGDWKSLAGHIRGSASGDVVSSTERMLSSWGFGMGRVAAHTDTVVETLRQVISAYMLADLLRVKDFSPTADNIAKLPSGKYGMQAWQEGYRPKFDPPPHVYQEPWLDDDGKGDGGSGVGGEPSAPPRQRYGGGWESGGGSKEPIA